jgi:hypothetical protein
MAEGVVLHHNRDELHGITVVVTGVSGKTYVGRWHERKERGVVMRDVATLSSGEDVASWLEKLKKFGVPPQERVLVVAEDEFESVRRFANEGG